MVLRMPSHVDIVAIEAAPAKTTLSIIFTTLELTSRYQQPEASVQANALAVSQKHLRSGRKAKSTEQFGFRLVDRVIVADFVFFGSARCRCWRLCWKVEQT